MITNDHSPAPLARRLRDGLERIAGALRSEQWQAAGALGLTPTQLHILIYLAGRGDAGARVTEIGRQLGISQPTASDSAAALQRKTLIFRAKGTQAWRNTPAGQIAVSTAGLAATGSMEVLSHLSIGDQESLLLLLIKLIRGLQASGAIVPQRLCVTCQHFRPNAHPGSDKPHHCAFVNAAFGTVQLRLDCGEHEPADPASQAATWETFTTGAASIQASN